MKIGNEYWDHVVVGEEFRPCKDCDCEPELISFEDGRFALSCTGCDNITRPCDSKEEAMKAWEELMNDDDDSAVNGTVIRRILF